MVDPLPNPQPLGPDSSGAARVGGLPGAGRANEAAPEGAGAEFQVLLDRIETRARQLAVDTDSVEAPDQLAGAVDAARESLEDVLDLKERLLEAYRQQQQQTPPARDGGGAV